MTHTANNGELLYTDPLVAISDQQIRIKCYHIWGSDKCVPWENVQSVQAMTPTLWNGKWRLWGTGGFTTWFAADFDRPARQTIFVVKLRTQRVKVGFTVHDAARVKELLQQRGVLVDQQGPTPPPQPLPPAKPLSHSPALYAIIGLTLAIIAQAIYHHPQLPKRAATHFGADGNADGWGPRAVLTISAIAASVFVAAAFGLIALACAKTAAAAFGQHLLWIGVATIAFLGVFAHLTYRANLSPPPSLGMAPWYALGAYLLSLALWAVLWLRKLA